MIFEKVSDSVYYTSKDSGRSGRSSFYVIDLQEEGLALIDTGIQGTTKDQIKHVLSELQKDISDIKRVFLTHVHHDAIGGYFDLLNMKADFTLYASIHYRYAFPQIKQFLKEKAFLMDRSDTLSFAITGDPFQKIKKVGPVKLIRDGDSIQLGEHKLFFFHYGGHSTGHMLFLYTNGKVLFGGDSLTIQAGSYENYSIDNTGALRDFQRSLNFIEQLKFRKFCPAQDIAINKTDTNYEIGAIRSTIEHRNYVIESYLEEMGMTKLKRLTADIYERQGVTWNSPWDKLIAKTTINAHLKHLMKQGKVEKHTKNKKDPYFMLSNG